MSTLRQAAQAVIERWDSPLWKYVPATAVYIADLRTALAAPEPYDQQALEPCDKCGWKAVIPGEPCLNCARDALTKERDALMSDGARYRFLKSCTRVAGLDIDGRHSWTCQIMRSDIKGPTLDEAIDAAIKKAGVQ